MKIRLIQPTQLDENGSPIRYNQLLMPATTMPTLAALTPKGIDVRITDDYVEEIDLDEDVDIVGITAMTCQVPRAYQIADEFRKRGKKTIMGGIHATFCPEEALQHFDSVLIGEAEEIWEQVIEDVRSNNLKRIYRASQRPDLSQLAIPRFDLLNFNNYVTPPLSKTPCIPIQATRGCPHDCDFCSVHPFLGHKLRKKPVSHVVKEIEAFNPSLFFFSDDNIGGDPKYTRELLAGIRPLKMRWACFMSTAIMKHPDLIKLAAKAGCHETFVGVESINENSLKLANKTFNKINEYKELFKCLKDVGILAQASFIFGLDGDAVDTLRKTIDIVLEWDIKLLYIFILLPLPGTRLYQQMEDENRFLSKDWSLYDGIHSVLRYKELTQEDLLTVLWESYEKFYSINNIFKTTWRFRKQYIFFFPRNNVFEDIFFLFHIRKAIRKRKNALALGLERER